MKLKQFKLYIVFVYVCAIGWSDPVQAESFLNRAQAVTVQYTPQFRIENFSERKKWREERLTEKHRVIREHNEEKGQRQQNPDQEINRYQKNRRLEENYSLTPEERRELRRQIRRANRER